MTKVNLTAFLILAIMFLLMLGSVWNDSAIIDELAHIPAGFGYLKGDYRLNPEHPPLLKTLAAVSSWLAVRPNFPTDTRAWQDDVNGQWDQGAVFFYESQNDANQLIFWARLPLIFLALLFGWLMFRWVQKKFGSGAALISLSFFAFSPTILTHSRYVTTDLGAAFGFFIGMVSFVWFLERPSWKNAALAGLVFGIAQLLKFSAVLLIPTYGILFIAWVFTLPRLHLHERLRTGGELFLKIIVLGLVGFALVWAVYALHTFNYPQGRQTRDTEFLLSSYGTRPVADAVVALTKNDFTRPFAHYLLGVLMVNQRAAGGNTQYFLGEISAAGFTSYFPTLYLLKEPLAFHLLTLMALWFGVSKVYRAWTPLEIRRRGRLPMRERIGPLTGWINNHFTEFAAMIFIAFYWALSISSPLNIGIRHVLPTFPFIYLLVSRQIAAWLRSHEVADPKTWFSWFKNIIQFYIKAVPKLLAIGVLLLWLAFGSIAAFPNFMTYYNELGGGERNGYKTAVDSNYDWGQDLKRLQDYAEKNNIQNIAVDYFGGGQVKYYFGQSGENWWSARGPVSGWFAVSATVRQGAFGEPVAGFARKPEDSYLWLKPFEPVARIGSIFVYKLP